MKNEDKDTFEAHKFLTENRKGIYDHDKIFVSPQDIERLLADYVNHLEQKCQIKYNYNRYGN